MLIINSGNVNLLLSFKFVGNNATITILSGTTRESGNTYYAFDSTISGFVEGDTNTLVFNTTDKATNSAAVKTLSAIKIDTTDEIVLEPVFAAMVKEFNVEFASAIIACLRFSSLFKSHDFEK